MTASMSDAQAIRELRTIPSVGPAIARDLLALGFRSVASLKGADPQRMYDRLSALTRSHQDPCVLYTFRCVVYYASRTRHDPELLKWWNWKDRHDPLSPKLQTRPTRAR
jgi:hypothetical protein